MERARTMLGAVIFFCSLSTFVHGALEDLKKEVFTSENTGKWKGKSGDHVPMLELDAIKGGGWHAMIWTTHVKKESHFIGKLWAEDGDGNVVAEQDFSPTDDNPLNQDRNQTMKFKIPKGTKEPLTTYAWCDVHGTWAHAWTGIPLWHFQDDVKVDEHGNEIPEEPEEPGTPLRKKHEVPQHAKVSAEELKEFKTNVYTIEEPGPWRGKAGTHIPNLDLHPVEGGGWIAELETTHGKDSSHFISKHWIEDGEGNVLGVVDFDINDNDEKNQPKRQVSQFHVPKRVKEPLTTYAYCNLHGAWAHTWAEGIAHSLIDDVDEKDEL